MVFATCCKFVVLVGILLFAHEFRGYFVSTLSICIYLLFLFKVHRKDHWQRWPLCRVISKIKKSIQQDLATNKLSAFTALVINTLVLTSNPRDDTFNKIIFWISLILEVLIIFSISAMIYYKVKKWWKRNTSSFIKTFTKSSKMTKI